MTLAEFALQVLILLGSNPNSVSVTLSFATFSPIPFSLLQALLILHGTCPSLWQCWTWMAGWTYVLPTLLIDVIKYPTKVTKEKRVCLGLHLHRTMSIITGRVWWQEQTGASHIASTVRKQRGMHACTHLCFPFHLVLDPLILSHGRIGLINSVYLI